MTHPMSYLVNGTLPKGSAEISNSVKVFKLVSMCVNTMARERDKALLRFIVLVIARPKRLKRCGDGAASRSHSVRPGQ
jgi:hypothetical protein